MPARRLLFGAAMTVLAVASALPSPATAAPTRTVQQGRLLDDTGAPLSGTQPLVFRLFDAPQDGVELWTEQHEASFQDGYYAVTLGEVAPLDDTLFEGASVWLELSVDGDPLIPRQELTSVPYALRATSAQHLQGGVVDAVDIAVAGTPVINNSGQWVGPALDWSQIDNIPADIADGDANQDTLSDLAPYCQNGDVAKWSVTTPGLWDCAPDVDTTLDETQVESMVANSALDLHADTTIGGAAVLSSTTCSEGEILSYSGGAWVCTSFQTLLDSDGDGSMAWNDCDDADAGLLDQSLDNDCDGVLAPSDCDDNDVSSTVVADDGDCDGVLTALDCNDSDATSTTLATDGDCDGTITANDCDDSDDTSTTIFTDGDCDGVITANDCDDSDAGQVIAPTGTTDTCAGPSCLAILDAGYSTGDGTYWINPTGASAFQALCDMTTEGGGYTYFAVDSGTRTYRVDGANSCPAGTNIVYPRSRDHWVSLLARFDSSYLDTAPGVYKPGSGGNYTSCAMNSNGCNDWQVLDGGRWWLRDSPMSEPNGDYTGYCWLSLNTSGGVDNFSFNDGHCSYSTIRYICSTNDKL